MGRRDVYEPLNGLLDGRYAVGLAATPLGAKIVATAASVGSGSPGGVLTPAFAHRRLHGLALRDRAFGVGAPLGEAGGYALVGMAAATAATTHAPLPRR